MLANAVLQTITTQRMYKRLREQAHSHREGVVSAKLPAPIPASSWLKPVPSTASTAYPCRTGFSREAFAVALALAFAFDLRRQKSKRHQSRLGCRLNAGLAQWDEPHGCGESAVRTWMSVRRGPTERDRSEGTLTKEGPNREQAPLVTWGWCDFRLFQVTRRRRNSLPPGRRS